MLVNDHQRYFVILLFIIISMTSSGSLLAAGRCTQWVAKIVSMQGSITTRSSDDTDWSPAGLNQTYCSGDIIHVAENSRAAIELSNETIIRLDQKTTIVLSEIKEDEDSWLEVLKGAIHVITRVPKSLKIKTPYVNAFVEGTEFTVTVEDDQTVVSVIEGNVKVENDRTRLVLMPE